MAIVSFNDIYSEIPSQRDSPITNRITAILNGVNDILFYELSLTEKRIQQINLIVKGILLSGMLFGTAQSSIVPHEKTRIGHGDLIETPLKGASKNEKPYGNEEMLDGIPKINEPIIYAMPDLSPKDARELSAYIDQLRKDFSSLKWNNGKDGAQNTKSQEYPNAIVSKTENLYNFYRNNRKIIDNMARFSGGGKLNDVCGSTILVPWILYTSNTIKEAWENIHQLAQINYKHGKNWSIILEALVEEGIAEKINPQDLLTKTIPEGTILTYDGTQSSGAGKIYGHVEMTLSESSLDDGHFYYGNENTRAGGSASSKINLQSAVKLFEKGIRLFGSADIKKAKGSLGGLIGAYKIKSGTTPEEVLAVLADIDIKSGEKDIPSIALSNYSANQ